MQSQYKSVLKDNLQQGVQGGTRCETPLVYDDYRGRE